MKGPDGFVQARGFRQFLLRGVAKVQGEWALVCTTHNILKLYRLCAWETVEGPPRRGHASPAAPARSSGLLTERSVDHDRHAAARGMTDIPITRTGS